MGSFVASLSASIWVCQNRVVQEERLCDAMSKCASIMMVKTDLLYQVFMVVKLTEIPINKEYILYIS